MLQRTLLGVVVVTVFSAAQAAEPAPVPRADVMPPELRMLLGGLVTEKDVGLLFDHLRASMRASAEGRPPPPLPEALARRLEVAGSELQLRGLVAGMVLTQFVERAVRDAVRELGPPPTSRDGY